MTQGDVGGTGQPSPTVSEDETEGWFKRIPRRFFRYGPWGFATYVGLGFVVAGVLHHRIWIASPEVETLFTNFGLGVPRPTPRTAVLLFAITGAMVAMTMHRLFLRIEREDGDLELVFWGTAVSMVTSSLPWLFASSGANTLFLFLYGMVAVAGCALGRRVEWSRPRSGTGSGFDPWKTFVNAVKACASVVAVLLGGIATSVLLPWRSTNMEGPELFRYALLSAYLFGGMLVFILLPLFAKALEQGPTADVELEPPGTL